MLCVYMKFLMFAYKILIYKASHLSWKIVYWIIEEYYNICCASNILCNNVFIVHLGYKVTLI